MTTETATDIPPCPDSTLWAYTTYRADRRTKSGLRLVERYTMNFTDEREALLHAQDVEANTGYHVEYRKYWVLKRGFMSPHKAFWEAWHTPYACSPASETYWST